MKTNREYPATHSMSTAWYIVDDEGNVGILDYNENGPVPHGIPEHGISELVWGLWDDSKRYKRIPIKLTIEQIYENMSKGHSPEDEDLWYDCIVKIKTESKDRFLQLCNDKRINECICISEDEGLYIFDAFDCTDHEHGNWGAALKGSPLETILKEGIIQQAYRLIDFDNDDTFNSSSEVPEHSKNYDSCAFFIYHQPYWEDFLPQKMSIPEHPVNIDQLPEEIKNKVHHIPGNFRNIDTFQIAEFYPSDTTYCLADPIVLIDGCEYNLLPLPDGTKAYLLSDESTENKNKYTVEEFEALRKLGRATYKDRK